jgi:hypothetical protein
MVQDCRWLATGQQLMCATEGTMTQGPYHDVTIMGYDAEAKGYKGYDADNSGMAPFVLVFKDNTWTFNYEFRMAGKPVKLRMTAFDLSRDGGSVKQEFSMGGGPWTLLGEGKVRKIGS